MASAEFDEKSAGPAVQVGDPFMESLFEACLG
jgi:phosphoribosylformylglycinamidine (FGAM) synthase-like enzyme